MACDMNSLEILCSFPYSCYLPLLRISAPLNHVNTVTHMDRGQWPNGVSIDNSFSVERSATILASQ